MKKMDSKSENYGKYLERAFSFIENNLESSIMPQDVAKAAALSYYHFHRVFKAVVGKTLKEYIAERQLTEAAIRIQNGNSIIDTTYSCGFKSQETFTRAFKRRYKITPGLFRSMSGAFKKTFKYDLTDEYIDLINEVLNIEPEIIELDELKCAGVSRSGENDNEENLKLHKLFFELTRTNNTVDFPKTYSADIYNTSFPNGENYTYYFGAEIKDIPYFDNRLEYFTFLAGTYALFTFKGKAHILTDVIYRYIDNIWEPTSKWKIKTNQLKGEFCCRTFLSMETDPFWLLIPVELKKK